MSSTGTNSGADPVGQPAFELFLTVFPAPSTHRGSRKPSTRSGTASARSLCLSPMDDELSIMNKRSILSTECSRIVSVIRVVVIGLEGTTGRSRQPATSGAPTDKAVAMTAIGNGRIGHD